MGPTVTDWINAITGVLTLLAAAAAGLYARTAAHWTKKQAQASDAQVTIADRALAIARNDAEVARSLAEGQRREAALAARRLAEDRADSLMPTVLIRATPGTRTRSFVQDWRRTASGRVWEDVESERELTDADRDAVFRLSVTFHLENLSDRIARVAFTDAGRGEVDFVSSDGLLLRPHAQDTFTWTKAISANTLRTEEEVHEQAIVRAKLWVRDLGFNAYDVVDVVLDLRVFTRDGSRLRVTPKPLLPWLESIGTPLPERVYDRLNAAASTTPA